MHIEDHPVAIFPEYSNDFVLLVQCMKCFFLCQNPSREKAARQVVGNALKSVWSRPTLVQIAVEYCKQSTSLVIRARNLPYVYGLRKGR